jgi:hypothetical protein
MAQLGTNATNFCEQVVRECRFDYASLQLVRPDENLIETVAGAGSAAMLARVTHRLAVQPALRDIHADILDRRVVEVICGPDIRVDAYVYKQRANESFSRVYGALVVLLDPSGKPCDTPRHECSWRASEAPGERRATAQRTLELAFGDSWTAEVIGTVEGGFETAKGRQIGEDEALDFARVITDVATGIYRATLSHLFYRIAGVGCSLARADAASLDVIGSPEGHTVHYLYEPQGQAVDGARPQQRSGKRRKRGGPTADGGEPQDPSEMSFLEDGRVGPGTAALALSSGPKSTTLSLHFEGEREFTGEEAALVELFRSHASMVVREAFEKQGARDRLRKQSAICDIVQSFLGRQGHDEHRALLDSIASNARSTVGADIVSIQRWANQRREPHIENALVSVGRMLVSTKPIRLPDVRGMALEGDRGIFSEHADVDPLFSSYEDSDVPAKTFVEREGIRSMAVLPLLGERGRLGVIFFGFRERHQFAEEERELLRLYASLAGSALERASSR